MLATVVVTFVLLLALNAASGAAEYQRFTVRVVWPGGTNCSAPLSAACNDTGTAALAPLLFSSWQSCCAHVGSRLICVTAANSGLTSWPEGWAASDPSQGGGDWSGGSKSFSNPVPSSSPSVRSPSLTTTWLVRTHSFQPTCESAGWRLTSTVALSARQVRLPHLLLACD